MGVYRGVLRACTQCIKAVASLSFLRLVEEYSSICSKDKLFLMSSTTEETAVSVNGQTASDQPMKVGVKRKRTPSLEGKERRESESKKRELVNGVTDSSEGEEEREKVAILDAGAQYGKVRVHTPMPLPW